MSVELEKDLSNESYLVTGGCGFVGSNIVNTLLARGASCTVVDDLFTGLESNLVAHPKLTVHIGCLTDEKLLRSALGNCNRIIHCGVVNIMAAETDPAADLRVNAMGTQLIARLATEFDHIDRLVYTSSASVYGNPRELPVEEDRKTSPSSYYAISKLAGEHYVSLEHSLHDTPTTIVRYSNVYGENQHPQNPYSGVVAKFFKCVHSGEAITVYGSGDQTRDFTYVKDSVSATILASLHPSAIGEVFNIGTGVETSILQLATVVGEVIGSPVKFNHIEERGIDNIDRRQVDVRKIDRILGWKPKYDLAVGLAETWKWLGPRQSQPELQAEILEHG